MNLHVHHALSMRSLLLEIEAVELATMSGLDCLQLPVLRLVPEALTGEIEGGVRQRCDRRHCLGDLCQGALLVRYDRVVFVEKTHIMLLSRVLVLEGRTSLHRFF